jgi:hypothetical protein
MGKLQTAVGLPKKILLQGWAGDQGDNDINGEYTFYYESYLGIGTVTPIQNVYLNLNKIASDGVVDIQNIIRPAIVFNGYNWYHESDDDGWSNPSTNSNVLPFTGWVIENGLGPAGTITILENISGKNNKISIKKQNLGGGKINLNKKYLYKATGTSLTPNINGLRFYDSGLIQLDRPIYYDETNTYKLRWAAGFWALSRIDNTIGDFVRFNISILGNYTAASGWSGTVTISEI